MPLATAEWKIPVMLSMMAFSNKVGESRDWKPNGSRMAACMYAAEHIQTRGTRPGNSPVAVRLASAISNLDSRDDPAFAARGARSCRRRRASIGMPEVDLQNLSRPGVQARRASAAGLDK